MHNVSKDLVFSMIDKVENLDDLVPVEINTYNHCNVVMNVRNTTKTFDLILLRRLNATGSMVPNGIMEKIRPELISSCDGAVERCAGRHIYSETLRLAKRLHHDVTRAFKIRLLDGTNHLTFFELSEELYELIEGMRGEAHFTISLQDEASIKDDLRKYLTRYKNDRLGTLFNLLETHADQLNLPRRFTLETIVEMDGAMPDMVQGIADFTGALMRRNQVDLLNYLYGIVKKEIMDAQQIFMGDG